MATLTILRGVPGSGKTSWTFSNQGTAKRVSKDDLRAMLDDGVYSPANEKFVEQVQEAIIRVAGKVRKGLVIDDCNIHPRHIARLTELAEETGFQVRIVDMDTPLEECIARDAQRPRPIGEWRIRQMWDKLQAQKK